MIQSKETMRISSSPDVVYGVIETMPNKFPIYKVLETKPFLFLRMTLVDGLHVAIKSIRTERPTSNLIMNIGDSFGPFTLRKADRPREYWFSLESFFINCQTGFSLTTQNDTTVLDFFILAEKPSIAEKIWWFIFKPFHVIFANKVLRIIREKVELR